MFGGTTRRNWVEKVKTGEQRLEVYIFEPSSLINRHSSNSLGNYLFDGEEEEEEEEEVETIAIAESNTINVKAKTFKQLEREARKKQIEEEAREEIVGLKAERARDEKTIEQLDREVDALRHRLKPSARQRE